MTRQMKLMAAAISYYTRLPVRLHQPSAEIFRQSSRYFPLVGYIHGITAWLCMGASSIFDSTTVQALAIIGIGVLLTGALHEDGFADACDGFGGGYGRDKILAIMKDSRLGTYGTLGLILLITSKIALYTELLNHSALSFPFLILIHTLSRCAAITLTWVLPYARQGQSSTGNMLNSQITAGDIWIPILVSLPVCLLQSWSLTLTSIALLVFSTALAKKYFFYHIQGFTGDCLGTIVQINELLILLTGLFWATHP